jgi:hypothetical protein
VIVDLLWLEGWKRLYPPHAEPPTGSAAAERRRARALSSYDEEGRLVHALLEVRPTARPQVRRRLDAVDRPLAEELPALEQLPLVVLDRERSEHDVVDVDPEDPAAAMEQLHPVLSSTERSRRCRARRRLVMPARGDRAQRALERLWSRVAVVQRSDDRRRREIA